MYKSTLFFLACLVVCFSAANAQNIYLDPIKSIDERAKDLVSKLTLEAKNVQFNLTPDILKSIDDNGQSVLPTGDYHVYIGASQPSKRSEELGMSKPADIVLKVK